MPRVDLRINVSFKNNKHEEELFKFVKEKGKIMGESAYIKLLIEKDKREEDKKSR